MAKIKLYAVIAVALVLFLGVAGLLFAVSGASMAGAGIAEGMTKAEVEQRLGTLIAPRRERRTAVDGGKVWSWDAVDGWTIFKNDRVTACYVYPSRWHKLYGEFPENLLGNLGP
jgi:ABC-type branched-subunit amino acid transport system permease subunit